MLNIGIFQLSENEMSQRCIKRMSVDYSLSLLSEDVTMRNNYKNLKAIIAFENDIKDIPKLCELLILAKEFQDCYVFIISTVSLDTGSMVYLRLGCDFVFNLEEQTVEEVFLVIQNALARLKNAGEDSVKHEKKTDSPLLLIHDNFSVLVAGETEVSLTKLEYKVLDILAQKPNVAFSYEEIYEGLYKYEEKEAGEIKTYRVANIIFHLRKKIEESTSSPKYIKTVRTKGYMLDVTGTQVMS